MDKYRRQRGADHAIVVAPGFAPKVIHNAETTDLTTIAVDDLVDLLDRRVADPADVASVCVFSVSELARYSSSTVD